ncbi:MAG: ATP-binding protein [Pseudomonadota bacterium]
MTPADLQAAVRTLHAQGRSLRAIGRAVGLSRNTVRRILRQAPVQTEQVPFDATLRGHLQAAYEKAGGNAVRVRELLAAEHGLSLSYSTLTRWLRLAGLRTPPRRAGEYVFAPGQEMQHDTSPHKVMLGATRQTLQCAALVLACSRKLFIHYYTRFTRFEAKHFLLEAAVFMDGVCPVCVVDNSHVVLAGGSGADAVIAPEMQAFARALGFAFRAHRIGHPDRKGRIERPFAWVEGNFLAGRSFADLADLNAQARTWCNEVANAKPKRALGMSPEAAYRIEQMSLKRLPATLPPVYDVLERVVDLHGFVSVDTHRYSVPERWVGQSLTVYKHFAEIRVYRRQELLATHPRLSGRDGRSVLPGHHTLPSRAARTPALAAQWADDPLLARYVAALRHQAQIHTLAGLDFVKRAENLLLIGPPGTGKTGLAIGLLREACLNGYRGCFYNAQDLLDEIYASLADRSTSRLLQTLSRRTPMVIDELGYMSLKPEQVNAFFRLMDQRYNRATTIITTNLEPTSWYELFQNKSLVDALLDRLQHHCITIRINGPSLRSAEPAPAPVANATAPAVARRPTKRPAR